MRKLNKDELIVKIKESKATVPVMLIMGLLLFLSLIFGVGSVVGKREIVSTTKSVSDSQKQDMMLEMEQIMTYLATLDETVLSNQNALDTVADYKTLYKNKSEKMKASNMEIQKLINNYLNNPDGVDADASLMLMDMLEVLEAINKDIEVSDESFVSLLEEYKTADQSRRLEIEKELQTLQEKLMTQSSQLTSSFQNLQKYMETIEGSTEHKELYGALEQINKSMERYLLEEMTSFTNLLESTSLNMATKLEQGISNLKEEMNYLQNSIHTTQNDITNLYTTVESNDGESSQVISQEFATVKSAIATLNEEFKEAHKDVKKMISDLNKDMDKYYEEQKKELETYFADLNLNLETYFGSDKEETGTNFENQNEFLEESFTEQTSNLEKQNQLLEEKFAEQSSNNAEQNQLLEDKFNEQTSLLERLTNFLRECFMEQSVNNAAQNQLLEEKFAEQSSNNDVQNQLLEEKFAEQSSNNAEQNQLLEEKFAEQSSNNAEQNQLLEEKFAEQNSNNDVQNQLLEEKFTEQSTKMEEQNKYLEDIFAEQSIQMEGQNNHLEDKLENQEQLMLSQFLEQTTHFDEVYVQLQGILEEMSSEMETLLNEQFAEMFDVLTEMEDTYLTTMEDYHNKTIWNLNAMNESMTGQHEELTSVISSQYQNMTSTMNNNNNLQQESFDNLMTYLDQKLSQVFTFVSDGKKKIVSALLTKGVDINEDATFTQLYDAIMSIEQELFVGVEKIPGDVTYQYHYHTDVNGDEIHAATCPLEQMGGCYTVPVYHYHEDANGTAQAASYQAPNKGGCFVNNVYHSHVGASTGNGGCYTTPVYHTHTGNASAVGGCYGNVPYTVYKYCGCSSYVYSKDHNGTTTCGNCGHNHGGDDCDAVRSSYVAYKIGLTCGKSTSTIDRYDLSCGMTTETVIGYSLGCGMTTSTIVAYQPGCGLSDGQIVGAIIVYDDSAVMPAAVAYRVRPVVEVPQITIDPEENIVVPDIEVSKEEITQEEEVVNPEESAPEDPMVSDENLIPEESGDNEGEGGSGEELPKEEVIPENSPTGEVTEPVVPDEIPSEPMEPILPEEHPTSEEPAESVNVSETEAVHMEEVVQEITETNMEGGDS